MLSSSYALFKIVTKSHDWKVFRRFSEFFTLRNYLLKMFPSILVISLIIIFFILKLKIPPIPSKQVGRNLDIGYLNKRRSFLQVKF